MGSCGCMWVNVCFQGLVCGGMPGTLFSQSSSLHNAFYAGKQIDSGTTAAGFVPSSYADGSCRSVPLPQQAQSMAQWTQANQGVATSPAEVSQVGYYFK